MKISIAFSFFLFNFSFLIHAQQIWYFGNGAGLDFSSGTPKPIYNGKLFTLEGCATACDDHEHLLFYTDGITVWNKFHKEMQNGTGLNGSQSSTQAALIVPQPSVKGKYFLFTTDEKGGSKGLCYSVIDISSAGGVVIKKNIQLLGLSTEKLSAVQSANGKDSWVITHQWNSNSFYAFPVTAQGIGKPVISAIGLSHTETGAGENREAIGYLCASPDGKKIASAVCYRGKNNLELFDFDNSTGKISNASTFSLSGSPYGLCFSSDNTKLYISFLKGRSGIVQYDLNDRSIIEIAVDEKENSFGGLKMGLDEKIYIARTGTFLDAIEFPNEKGALCKYKKNGVDLEPASSNFGLPNVFITSSAGNKPITSVSLTKTSSSPENSSTSATSHSFDCSKVIEKPFSQKGQMVMTSIEVCENEYVLSAKNFGASFNWSTLETTQKIKVNVSQVYKVAIFKQGCTVIDSIHVKFRKDLAEFTFLPSFNPESESFNSEFYYEIADVQDFELKVYDRKKKNILFDTKNIKKKWNGKNQKGDVVSAGEYFWVVKYKPNCPKDSKAVVKEGSVIVKRGTSKK